MSKIARETQIAKRFAKWLSDHTSQFYTVTRGPNPPDFLLNPGSWLELSNIYLSNEEAKFDNSREGGKFTFECSLEQTVERLLQKLDEKLAKASYREIYEQRGKGILLLTCQDFFFDAVNLTRVQQRLESFHPTKDHGFFEVAYFEYRVPAADRVYRIIYPAGYVWRVIELT